MQFPSKTTVQDLVDIIQVTCIGDSTKVVPGMNEIHAVTQGDLIFVDHPKYYKKALHSVAGVILINEKMPCPEGKTLLISDDPFRDYNRLTERFRPFESQNKAISDTAVIGKNTIIQPNCFIGNHVQIGDNCLIHPNVIISDHTVIGNNVTINAGTVIGGNAFYYKKREKGYDRLLSGGRVVIADWVEIGCSCTIDRGVSGDTFIDQGTKLDNQVHVGHDTRIGKNCLIVSQVGIAGCVVIEDEVTIWGQVGIKSEVVIGEKTTIYAQSGVTKSLEANKTYFGLPAVEYQTKLREMITLKKLTKNK